MPASPSLSVVIPAYDEAERIGASLRRMRAHLEQHHPRHEVLVVDDGSSDDTAGRVERLAADWPRLRVIRLATNRGKGHATRTGVLAAEGDWVLCSDADLSTPIAELEVLLAAGRRRPVVIGSRSLPGARIERPQPLYRRIMGRAFNRLARLAAAGAYADTQCGFKLFSRDAARAIFSRVTVDGFAFDVEVLFLARRLGYPIGEVPVVWNDDRNTKVDALRDPARMFADLIAMRLRHRRR
jgi:dolichyl-phosphate beta-glucosyltransferase